MTLQRVRLAGKIVLLAELTLVLALGGYVYGHYAVTADYGVFNQARWLIAHGHLNPDDSMGGIPFWQNHAEWIMWPLALVTRLLPAGGLVLLWVQGAATVGTQAVAFLWILERVGRPTWSRRFPPPWAALLGLILLVGTPWFLWSTMFDFHFEALAALFLVLAARDLDRGRHRMWLWVLLLLGTGDVSASYLVGLGISAALIRRGGWRLGAVLAVLGVSWVGLMTQLHANIGSTTSLGTSYFVYQPIRVVRFLPNGHHFVVQQQSQYNYTTALVSGLVHNPLAPVRTLAGHALNMWANLSPSGIVGLASGWGLGVPAVVLLTDSILPSAAFSLPSFQTVPIYPFVTVGTVLFLGTLSRERRALPRVRFGRILHRTTSWWARRSARVVAVVAAALSLQAIAWSAVWLPHLLSRWVPVTASGAAVLDAINRDIPPSAQVIASQGIVGRFTDREHVQPLTGLPEKLTVWPGPVYFVLSPSQGIETLTTVQTMQVLDLLTGQLHAAIVRAGADVWELRWQPPRGTQVLAIDKPALEQVPGWSLRSATGLPVLTGSPTTWHLAAARGSGYLAYGDYWRVPPGRYEISFRVATTAPLYVEVWDATIGSLIGRAVVPATDAIRTFWIDGRYERVDPKQVQSGFGPFSILPIEPPFGDELEVRVYSPTTVTAGIYHIGMQTITGSGHLRPVQILTP